MIKFEVQYFDGCPNAAAAVQLVKKYSQAHPETEVGFVQVQDNERAAMIGFRGSPTVLINGRDWFDMAVPEQPYMACRIYPAGIPSLELFSEMVQKMISI